MAFVRITNGRKTFNVSSGAYEEVYKGMGFHLVGAVEAQPVQSIPAPQVPHKEEAPKAEIDEPEETGEDTGSEEDDGEEFDVEGLLEKPLSQWTPDELKQFVAIKGIDTTGATKVKDVRNIVKQFLDNEAKNG